MQIYYLRLLLWVPKKAQIQSKGINPEVFVIEGSNFMPKPPKGKETAWWRLPERKGPRKSSCPTPKVPQNSPKKPQKSS